MKLPNEFQMRVPYNEGFTHLVKLNGWGDYEVTWAQGWVERLGWIPDKVFDSTVAEALVKNEVWIIVDDTPKEEALPDEFYMRVKDNSEIYTMRKERTGYRCFDTSGNSAWHSDQLVSATIKEGAWIVVDKKPLTAEQHRANKEFRERIAALEQSIKLNEQDVEHKLRLIGNYEATKRDLQAKIVEEF